MTVCVCVTFLVLNRLLLCCHTLSTDGRTDGRTRQPHVRVEGSLPPNLIANQRPGFSAAVLNLVKFKYFRIASRLLYSSLRTRTRSRGSLRSLQMSLQRFQASWRKFQTYFSYDPLADCSGRPKRESRVSWGGSSGPGVGTRGL